MKKYIISLIVIVCIVCAGVLYYQHTPTPTVLKIPDVRPSNTFTGKIKRISDGRSYDGALIAEIADSSCVSCPQKIVILEGGNYSEQTQIGVTIGFDHDIQKNVGKTVEVFATTTGLGDTTSLTLFGSNDYYVKVIR